MRKDSTQITNGGYKRSQYKCEPWHERLDGCAYLNASFTFTRGLLIAGLYTTFFSGVSGRCIPRSSYSRSSISSALPAAALSSAAVRERDREQDPEGERVRVLVKEAERPRSRLTESLVHSRARSHARSRSRLGSRSRTRTDGGGDNCVLLLSSRPDRYLSDEL